MKKTILITVALTTLMLTSISNIAKAQSIDYPVASLESNVTYKDKNGVHRTTFPGFIQCVVNEEVQLAEMFGNSDMKFKDLKGYMESAIDSCRSMNIFWAPVPKDAKRYLNIYMKNAVKHFPRKYQINISI